MRRGLSTVARGCIAVALGGVIVAAGAGQASTRTTGAAAAAVPGARVAYHAETGKVRFLTTPRGRPLARPAALAHDAAPVTVARAFLAEHGALFGVDDERRELRALRTSREAGGRSFVRFQQVHESVPVLGGELVVELDKARNPVAATGEVVPDVGLEVAPSVTARGARQRALEVVAKSYGVQVAGLRTSEPELWIYDPRLLGEPGLGEPTLVWRVEVTTARLSPIRELVLVDARLGAIALHFNQVETARNRTTYTANNTSALPGILRCSEASAFPACALGDSHVEGAHRTLADTYDFYATHHGRDSYDNAGAAMVATVHWRDPSAPGVPFANVFWNTGTNQIVVGDARTFAQADDIMGHELTHAVTERESNLFYLNQSGAINESLSDVWGELIDLSNGTGTDTPAVRWLLGEDALPGGAVRSLKDPTALADPDRMTSPFYVGGRTDGGGLHSNSGVNNKAAFLMVDGGTFNGKTVTGIGIDKTADVYYEAQTNLLTSASDYQALYDALQQACANLIGAGGITSADCQQVENALDAVEMNVVPPSSPTAEAPVCTSGTPTNLFFDNLESPSSGNWAAGVLAGSTRWYYPQNPHPFPGFDATYATSGVTNMWGTDYDRRVDTFIAQTASVALPAGPSFLRFEHSYLFEADAGSNYDGGIVEVSTNGGATWSDAGPLFTHGGYTGTLAAGFGNPLAGRLAFGDTSNGYGSSRLDLSSLAGSSVRFRFRLATDSSIGDYGWFVDDVRIYTCATGAPGAPTNVRAVAGDGEATVTFAAPASGGSSPISSYRVTASPGGQTVTSQGTQVVFVYGLANGTSYTFTVTATNASGDGPPSAPSAPVTPADTGGREAPAPPAAEPRASVPSPPAGGPRVPPPGH